MGLIWLLTAIFPLAEMTGWQGCASCCTTMGTAVGLPDWAANAYWRSWMALITFLGGIVYTTHMDKIFNWIFSLCPRAHPAVDRRGLDHP